ncbi:terminase small subunit [Pseudomonas putida]|uniref:terminase small subunit n=2 Tax=Pseudomonas TaxID=286 RepID=UPI000761F537|nr:terminase small subunit [Pseudomonas putida]MDG9815820.1 terminase small subunit [Pseudomonas putida]
MDVSGPAKPARSLVAKVVKKTTAVSKTAKTASPATRSPKRAGKKPAPERAKRSPEKEGNTKIENPIALSEFELEALRIAESHGLDRRQQKFIDLWVVCQNQGQAYRDAGYKCKNDNVAAVGASKLLKKVKDHPYTKWRQAELFKRTADIQNEIIEVVRSAALADVRELVEYRRRCCRHCYGTDHLYQFKVHEMAERQAEYDQLKAQADADGKVLLPFDPLGGTGYNHTLPPIDTCTNCYGDGVGRSFFKDTTNLSPGAVVLYEGVKEGKEGTEMRVSSKKAYLEMMAKIFDLQVEPAVEVRVSISDDDLNAIYAEAEATTAAGQAGMAERERLLAEGGTPT